ncbi:hypothetical protein HD554DRAFT_2035807 [Boletus coccyginus]|nr:hypothetical protein HD554DRAFT_2035807 [Boletus coccyginus]
MALNHRINREILQLKVPARQQHLVKLPCVPLRDDGGSKYNNDMDIYDNSEPVLCDQSSTLNPPPHNPLVSFPALLMHQEPLTSAIPTPGEPDLTTTNPSDEALLCSLWSEEFRQNIYDILCDHSADLFFELQEALRNKTFVPDGMILPPPPDELMDEAAEEDNQPGQSEIPVKELRMNVPADSLYYPWPSKSHFLTALLFSSTRLPFSLVQKKVILSWAKELGVLDVPTIHSVQKIMKRICDAVRNPSEKVTSTVGSVFYINDVGRAIAKDYANPLTCFAMQDYSEDACSGMSEVFHGRKMLLEAPSPPTARVRGKIYFMNKILWDESGEYFFPECFFLVPKNEDQSSTTDEGFIVNDEQEIVPTPMFQENYEDLCAMPGELDCDLTESSKRFTSLDPNPLCPKAAGWMVYMAPLIIFMDDVSGNISKQWNKHHAVYMSNANLPREMLEKEFCVHFVTSLPHATPMELMAAMKASIHKANKSGVVTWDCKEEEEVLLLLYGLFLAGDNPMQAEECSQVSLSGNHFCRMCTVGRTKEYKASEIGYNSLFTVRPYMLFPNKCTDKYEGGVTLDSRGNSGSDQRTNKVITVFWSNRKAEDFSSFHWCS